MCQDLPRCLGQGGLGPPTCRRCARASSQGSRAPLHCANHGGCAPLSVRHVYELGESVCFFTRLHFLIFYYIHQNKKYRNLKMQSDFQRNNSSLCGKGQLCSRFRNGLSTILNRLKLVPSQAISAPASRAGTTTVPIATCLLSTLMNGKQTGRPVRSNWHREK